MSKKDEKKLDEVVENPVENSQKFGAEFDEKDTKIAELTSDLQRTRADFENFRKTVDVQKKQAADFAKFATVEKLLPLLDNLELAFSNYKEELSPLKKSYEKSLLDLKLEKIESAEGTAFDPRLHEAVSVEEGEGEKEVIKATLRPGYKYEGEVIRPAMVQIKHI